MSESSKTETEDYSYKVKHLDQQEDENSSLSKRGLTAKTPGRSDFE